MPTEPTALPRAMGNLVRLRDLEPAFTIRLAYATPDNFTGVAIYQSAECYVDAHTAPLLLAARDHFLAKGLDLTIWDAYRPIRAQRKFWEVYPVDGFVAKPPQEGKPVVYRHSHMNGQSVDVTLTRLDSKPFPMPSAFDDFSPRARLDCPTLKGEALANGWLLRDGMTACGFTPYDGEWWHFNDCGAKITPYTDFAL